MERRPGNAAANRRSEGIAGPAACPRPKAKSVQPGTLTITWPHESGIGTRTASATTSGELSGAATGSLNVAQNLLSFAPNVLPPVGALLTVDYVAGPKQEDSFAHPRAMARAKVPVTATWAPSSRVHWRSSGTP